MTEHGSLAETLVSGCLILITHLEALLLRTVLALETPARSGSGP